MARFIKSLSTLVIILLVIGGILIYGSFGSFMASVKPVNTFEDLATAELEDGMHIEGDVTDVLGLIGYEETWKESSSGTRTKSTISMYYYAIPVGEKIIGVEIRPSDNDEMEKLYNEVYEYYMNGGAEPTTKIALQGELCVMEDDLKGLFDDCLEDMGYTQENIDALGEVYYVDYTDFGNMRVMFIAGVVIFALGIVVFILRFRKIGRLMQASSHDMFENVQFQSMEYETVDHTQENTNYMNE